MIWEFAREYFHKLGVLVLGPTEIAFFHFFFIVLHPPKSIFEKRSNHDGVIALAYEVLVHDVGGW